MTAREHLPDKIVARDLVLSYPNAASDSGHAVLKGFDLSVRDGEFLSLLGPSGCGKSTFLNILAGLVPQSSGDIRVDGEPVSAARHKLGVVFQGYALFPWRTVRKNVETGLEIRRVSRAQRRAEAEHYLRLVGLLDFADHYPHQLSGGMRQRVAIARALAYGPEVLLMDEPFGALDAQTRHILQEELLDIWRHKKKTVLFVTHDVREAVILSDRVVVMSARPGHVKAVIDIEGRGESGASIERQAEHIWSILRTEMTLT